MAKIIVCAPNFSEGRDPAVVAACKEALLSVPGIVLNNQLTDADHNRSSFNYHGEPQAVADATLALAKKIVELIDMNKHTGGHPRMGALDVVPLVPLKDVTEEEAIECSRQIGRRLWEELGVPVFYYEDSATRPERRNLSNVRKGQWEGMAEKLLLPDWAPDHGERRMHPTAGITAVGARFPMLAFNINLDTTDLALAKKIAKTIRQSGGGLDCVKAIGLRLEEKNMVQVSFDITDYRKAPMYRVLEFVKLEAARYNVRVVNSELVGSFPMQSIIDTALYYLHADTFDPQKQIFEFRLLD